MIIAEKRRNGRWLNRGEVFLVKKDNELRVHTNNKLYKLLMTPSEAMVIMSWMMERSSPYYKVETRGAK